MWRNRRLARLLLGAAGQLGEVVEQRLLRLRGVLLALRQAALVAQALDLVLDALALGLQRGLVRTRDVAPARIDGFDGELGGRLAVDTDRAGHGLGRQVTENDGMPALRRE